MRRPLSTGFSFRLKDVAPLTLFEAPVLAALRAETDKPKLGARVEHAGAWPRVLGELEEVEWVRYRCSVRFPRSRFDFRGKSLSQIYRGVLSGRIWPRSISDPLEREIKSLALLIASYWFNSGVREKLINHWKNHLVIHQELGSDNSSSSEAKSDEKRESFVRVEIDLDPISSGELFTFQSVKRSKDGKRWLKPVELKEGYRSYRKIALSISPIENRILKAIDAYLFAKSVLPDSRYPWETPTDLQAEHLTLKRSELFLSMVGFDHFYTTDGEALQVLEDWWVPRFTLSNGPSGGLTLELINAPKLLIEASEIGAWLMTPSSELMRCAREHLGALLSPLFQRPIEVEPGDIEEFVQGVLPLVEGGIDVQTTRLQALDLEPQPILRLTAEQDHLIISAHTRYEGFEPSHDDGLFFYDSVGLIRRDLEREAAHRQRVAALLGPAPHRLTRERAYDFLLDEVPRLGEGWSVDADKQILRPRGALNAKVSLASGVDWFDLDVGFEIGGVRVPLKRVLEAWRRQQRYVELPHGEGVARLPEAWLAQHGEAAEEIESLRRLNKGRLGAHNATAVEGLLEEALEVDVVVHWREQIARIRRFEQITATPAPAGLAATLRPYQEVGYAWLTALRGMNLGAILADDMGLGKTIQALCLLVDEARRGGRQALVVAPTSVIFNWGSEAARFTPALSTCLYHGPKRRLDPEARVVITSYPLLRRDIERLAAQRWSVVLLDEAQHIKNPHSAVAEAARRLDAEARFALTGTPIENHLMELWSIFQFLMPGFFGSAEDFKRRYFTPIQKHNDAEAMERLRARVHPFILRRLKREVAAELPPRQEQILYCELGAKQRRLYEAVRGAYQESVLNAIQAQGLERSTLDVLAALTRLRQACCHPDLVPLPQAKGVEESAKLDVLFLRLEQLIEDGHRSLIFSQWPSFLQIVRAGLEARGYDHLYLDGQTRDRGALQTRWNDPAGPPVFLISIKAGGSGLNLTGADHVFHLDPWWNPAVEQQANDRAHRIGQTKPVMIYKIVARDTAEEKILELQARKQALFDATVNADRLDVARLTQADLEAVFGPAEARSKVAKAPKTTGASKAPRASKTSKASKASKSPKAMKAPKTTKATKTASAVRAAKANSAETTPPQAPRGSTLPAWLRVLFEAHGDVTTGEVAAKMGGSKAAARAYLKGLEAAGELEQRGRGPATRYHLTT